MSDLTGKVAIITGGASGIGEATVRLFVEAGAQVVIADIQDERGERLAASLGERTIYQSADVSQEADVQELVQGTVAHFGHLDCLVNNAGIPGASGPLDELTVEGFDRTLAVNLRGVFLGMKYAIPIMRQQGGGTIVNTASIAGLRVGYSGHAYSVSKAAVIHLTKSVAMELGGAASASTVFVRAALPRRSLARRLASPARRRIKHWG